MVWKCLDCKSSNVKKGARYMRCQDCLSFDVEEELYD